LDAAWGGSREPLLEGVQMHKREWGTFGKLFRNADLQKAKLWLPIDICLPTPIANNQYVPQNCLS